MALASTGSISDPGAGHAPLSGYLTVWGICSISALVAALVLSRLPAAQKERQELALNA